VTFKPPIIITTIQKKSYSQHYHMKKKTYQKKNLPTLQFLTLGMYSCESPIYIDED